MINFLVGCIIILNKGKDYERKEKTRIPKKGLYEFCL